jgi:hypothetical protein
MDKNDALVAEQSFDDRSMRIFEMLVCLGALVTVIVLTAVR